MRGEIVLRQLGMANGGPDGRVASGAVLAVLLLYSASFFAFYPIATTNDDEARYLQQTHLILAGTQIASWIHPVTGETVERRPSLYPVGTAATIAPFVWIFGERGAWLAPFLSLLAGVGLTMRWIADEGRSPAWALVVLGFPPALVLGRVCASDGPSLAVVALGLWLFFRGIDRGSGWWVGAGFVAGASILFRESNALPFVTFFAGAVLRRERKAWALVVGGLFGLSLRLISSAIAYDNPFYVRGGEGHFGLYAIPDNWLLHPIALLVFVPGGLVFAAAYRGRRRPELISGVALFVTFYFLHWFGPPASGFVKRLIIELRYYTPLLPVFAFAMSESVPRLWRQRMERGGEARAPVRTIAAMAALLWVSGIASASILVHWALSSWSATQVAITREIATTGDGSVLVTNKWGTRKFLNELDRRYLPLDRDEVSSEDLATLMERHGGYYIALLDRSDSEYWRNDIVKNETFLASISPPPALRSDRRVTPTDRIRIWRVDGDRPDVE